MSIQVRQTTRHQPTVRVTPLEIILVCVAIAVAVILMASSVVPQPSSVTATRSVRVQSSQTLWDLARANPVEGCSTAQTVDHIRTLNNMSTSSLQAGQIITVPDATINLAVAAR